MSSIPTDGYIDNSIATSGYLPHETAPIVLPSGGISAWKKEDRNKPIIKAQRIVYNARLDLVSSFKIEKISHMSLANSTIKRKHNLKITTYLKEHHNHVAKSTLQYIESINLTPFVILNKPSTTKSVLKANLIEKTVINTRPKHHLTNSRLEDQIIALLEI